MANKTQLGIGAAIALLAAAYFGMDSNQSKNNSQAQAESSQQHQIDNSKNTQTQATHTDIESHSNSQNQHGLEVIRKAYDKKLSNVQVQSIGKVKAILRDDNEGSRHQKFILSLDNGLTVLVAHNIDLAPRIENLKKGDMVEFFGEYEYSNQGGVMHWTHHDPSRRHTNGWLKHDGKTYQ
ncbi:DUF3465 domain-containing protein [Acinetobacter sp. WCHAc060025]|uniref:DUF3465 domain-containing protein n=1 Tax=Acinetobacter sp. WCHAc060025 TaxID=2518625 RepID=UPI001023719C|nr:DUF3465 domain-containing protein [Acinetobacter sp. WCHAc060025]RZG76317.1 DUF3465 domain-containing protein [Acinetobacter sp. WCHAc060025]